MENQNNDILQDHDSKISENKVMQE
jgi:hypothetical protein